jgi:hypothetical protein
MKNAAVSMWPHLSLNQNLTEATPPEGIASKDDTTFYKVEPGTLVSFDVYFKNDFCVNTPIHLSFTKPTSACSETVHS